MEMTVRPRRLRKNDTLRRMVRETRMDKSSLIDPDTPQFDEMTGNIRR